LSGLPRTDSARRETSESERGARALTGAPADALTLDDAAHLDHVARASRHGGTPQVIGIYGIYLYVEGSIAVQPFREGDAVWVEGRAAKLIYTHRAAAVVRYEDDPKTRVVSLRKLDRRIV
jgi:hypothetical protein